ncbi:MAG: hypothetical protein ACK5E6_00230 [Cyanobacteriota bacterium]
MVHSEPGCRVVQVSGVGVDGASLGSALAEASTVEVAEEQALVRLLRRLAAEAPPLTGGAHSRRRQSGSPPSEPATAGQPATPEQPAPEQQAPPPVPPLEPPPDPEDWSEELAAIDAELRRLSWDRAQEGTYLQRCFGHASRSRITTYADLLAYQTSLRNLPEGADPGDAPVPLRRNDLIAQGEAMLASLGWPTERGRELLENHFGVQSRRQLNDPELLAFNLLLEGELLRDGGRSCD